jgi:hypothetical protein
MDQILKYDSENNQNSYATMSIASLGPSTLHEPLTRPKVAFISKPTEAFSSSNNWTSSAQNIFQSSSKHALNDVSDIDGAQPKQYRSRNYVSNGLKIDDIEGTKARVHDKFLWTKRHVDPLNPSYQLPTAEVEPYEPPKLLRDNLFIDDIPGTRTKQRSIIPNRDTLQIDDIEGTRSGWKPRHM